MATKETEEHRWYVLRDLKRPNAKLPAYKLLMAQSIKMFTPMRWVLVTHKGRKVREQRPFMPDLLFAYDTYSALERVVNMADTLQFRFLKGVRRTPMVVPTEEMERFIRAVEGSAAPLFYTPNEVTPEMLGHRIRIVGGPLDGYEGGLLTIRGSKVKRLLVDLPGFLFAGVEVNPDYIQLI